MNIDERLNSLPALKARMERLIEVVENAQGDVREADAAEMRVAEELRKMGQEALQGWAEGRRHVEEQDWNKNHPESTGHGKKKSSGTQPLETSKWSNKFTS